MTIRIEDNHDAAWIGDYAEEVALELLRRSLVEFERVPTDMDLHNVRAALSALQDACDDVVMAAERDRECELWELEQYADDPYLYNGVSRSDFVEVR